MILLQNNFVLYACCFFTSRSFFKIMQKSSLWLNNPILFRSVIRDNYEKFVDKLYDYSSLINVPNSCGETLLHYVCFLGMLDKYEALIHFDAKSQKTQAGDTLLHYSSISGYDDFLVIELIKQGHSPVELNNNLQSSIHFAANPRIAQYFDVWALNSNISIPELLDSNGNTVAHISAYQRNTDTLKFWLSHYPELETAKNMFGLTPTDIKKGSKIRFCPLNEL